MEKLRELDFRYQKIHQERLKIERKAKIQEAQDIQNNVLHCKTLENELRIIERQREVAVARNEKILSESLVKVNELNEKISRNSLIHSKNRLKNAKTQYFEVVTAGYPDWVEVLKDPESFQSRQIQENLEKLRQTQQRNEAEYKRKLELQMERMKTSEQLRSGMLREEEMVRIREQSLKENESKIEHERMMIRSQHEMSRAQEIVRHGEMIKEMHNEVFVEQGLRVSTPNAHIPNVFHLNRPQHERPYVPENYAGSFPDVQKFSISRPSTVSIERSRSQSASNKSPNVSQNISQNVSHNLSMSKAELQILPAPKVQEVKQEEKTVKIEKTVKNEKIEKNVKIDKNEKNFMIGQENFSFGHQELTKLEIFSSKPNNFDSGSRNVEPANRPQAKPVEPRPASPKLPEAKLIKIENIEAAVAKPEPAKVAKLDLPEGKYVQSKNNVSPGKGQSNAKEESKNPTKNIMKIVESSDDDYPSSLRIPGYIYPSATSKIPEQHEPSNSDSNEFDYHNIELPDNSSIPIIKNVEAKKEDKKVVVEKTEKVEISVKTGKNQNSGIMILDEDFDSGIKIIKGPPPKFNERKSMDEESVKTSSKKSEPLGKPDSGKFGLKVETKKNVKAVEIDDEFEIKTGKNVTKLKVPDVDVEGSLEDSSQLNNEYLQGFVMRENQSKASLNTDSRPSTNKASAKVEDQVLRKDSSSKHFGSTLNEPMSPSAVSSTTFFEVKMVASNKVLNSISIQQRRMAIKDLFNLLRDRLAGSGFQLENFNEVLKMQRVEKLYENYLMSKQSTKFKHNEELLGFILNLAKTLPDCFLPSDLAKSKHPFTENMIREKMRPDYFNIYNDIKDFLIESLRERWLDEDMVIMMFVDTLVNFSTSKTQFNRCKSNLGKVIKAEMSRPPTSNKDSNFDMMRVVTPNDRSLGGKLVAKSAGLVYSSVGSHIEAFQEILDDD